MIVDGQTVDYSEWSTGREHDFYSLRERSLDLPEGEPVVGYKAFYRATNGKLYPTEHPAATLGGLEVYENQQVGAFLEDSINEYRDGEGKAGGFYFWPTREQAEEYLDSAMLHARGYMYGTNFDDYQKNVPGKLEIHRVEGLYHRNERGDIGNVMTDMRIMETVISLTHREAFPFNYRD